MKTNENGLLTTRKKHRSEAEKKDLVKRLNIIDGQINGIKQMILDDRYCDEVIIQLSAVNKAIKKIANKMLKNHFASCVTEEINKGNLNIIDEIIDLLGSIE